VVTRRSIFELEKAQARAHILEGLAVALANIDEMIDLIKRAKNPQEAKQQMLTKLWPLHHIGPILERVRTNLPLHMQNAMNIDLTQQGYYLSTEQAQAILDLRLHRLTALEQEKIFAELDVLAKEMQALLEILNSPQRLKEVVAQELQEVVAQFGDPRRTEILDAQEDLSIEDLIGEQDVVVTLSHQGYVKYQSLDIYQAQRRGGKGKLAAAVKEEDFVSRLVIANTHDTLLCFSNLGRVYWIKVYQLPEAQRTARGRPIVNILSLKEGESINAMLPIKNYDSGQFVVMATKAGVIKKVTLDAFSRPRQTGIIAIDLDAEDLLIGVALTDGERDLMLFSDAGKVIRFPERLVRPMGRNARGVRAMRLAPDQAMISLVVVNSNDTILTATEYGYGKRTEIEEYRITGRGGQGVIAIQGSERNGRVVRALQVSNDDQVMLITDKGTLVRFKVSELSVIGRNTQGVRLISLGAGERLVGMQRIEDIQEESEE
jgi:DNA gyrase subunit A